VPVRVVVPRDIPRGQLTRVLRLAKEQGYEGRVVPEMAPKGWERVEFLILVQSKSPGVLFAFEMELDDFLHGMRAHSGTRAEDLQFSGTGSWIEPA
jgi:glycerol-3-phosphate dehydrogenase